MHSRVAYAAFVFAWVAALCHTRPAAGLQRVPGPLAMPPVSRLGWSEPPTPPPSSSPGREAMLAAAAVTAALAVQGLCYFGAYSTYRYTNEEASSYGDLATQAGPFYLAFGTLASSAALSGIAGASRFYKVPLLHILFGGELGAALAAGVGALYLGTVYKDNQYLDFTASTVLAYLPILLPVAGETVAYVLGRVPQTPKPRRVARHLYARWAPVPTKGGAAVLMTGSFDVP